MIYNLKEEHDFQHEHKGDAKKIKDALAKLGYGCLLKDCIELWTIYSESNDSFWMPIPKPSLLHKIIKKELLTQLKIKVK
jgi:hypothetical protein